MLKFVSLTSFLLYLDSVDAQEPKHYLSVVMADDDLRSSTNSGANEQHRRVKASFRANDKEQLGVEYMVCGCDVSSNTAGDTTGCGEVEPKNFDRLKTVTATAGGAGTSGMSQFYNETTGMSTIWLRGGYDNDQSDELALTGPGTLYTNHLDIEPRVDYLEVTDTDGDVVVLTGNYSACVRTRTGGYRPAGEASNSLESRYMDLNLSPGNQYSEAAAGNYGTSGDYHTTEETHNIQDDLCHDILTGKLLMPAPISIGATATLKFVSGDAASRSTTGGAINPNVAGSDNDGTSTYTGTSNSGSTLTNYYEGFELVMMYDDVYTTDVTTSLDYICVKMENAAPTAAFITANPAVAVADALDGRSSGVQGTPPDSTPSRVYFRDEDLTKLKISGTIEIEAGDTSGDFQTGYTIQLEKYEPAGRWGYALGQLVDPHEFDATAEYREGLDYGETTVYGPRDTWGQNGAPLPYYPTGGSTGTEAPKLLGGGPAGARIFNKHGDVVPMSARGGNPDYQAAEQVVDVGDPWECICEGSTADSVVECKDLNWNRCTTTISRQSGEQNGMGLQASQGSPPAPMYQLRVRACITKNTAAPGGSYVADTVAGDMDMRHCNMRDDLTLQLIDIGEYEAKATFYGDLDPKTRVLQGEITVVTPTYAMGLFGYRAYPTNDGVTPLPLIWSNNQKAETVGMGEGSANPQFILVLDKRCPTPLDVVAGGGNTDINKYCEDGGADEDATWCALAKEKCGNDNPYSPKCMGKTCPLINILPGSQGEFYISRYDNNGNQENPQTRLHGIQEEPSNNNEPQMYHSNTAQRNYSHNEFARIYLPKSGWLTPIMMDVNSEGEGGGDSLVVTKSNGNEVSTLEEATLSEYIDLVDEENVITWTTDEYDTAHGWTLIFQPNYPEISIGMGTPMAQGASGLRIVPVYHAIPTLRPLSSASSAPDENGQADSDGEEGDACDTCTCVGCAVEGTDNADSYVETYDWLVPNVTCTPTTMHCPLPTVWAHINYTTPSLYPEPAEGSCLQQKTGTSSLSGCSDKMDLNTRWYSANSPTTDTPGVSQQNTDEEDNAQGVSADTYTQHYPNWAGNCGDAASYFWFEKIACGSTRTFLTDRSLIEDFVQLTPTWEDIQQILDLYYTTKAPLTGRDDNVGFTFITADYHIAPVLPPKVNCTCHAAMDAYASLLSVVSKTPTPGAPVTLDPEVLNTGSSKMVATLRMYQDPTYSIPASSVAALPIVVTRFYLEVSTKFTRNRITISDCHASNKESLLNGTTSLKMRMNYCDNSTFDSKTERSPNGVTHMDRMSMKKFKFQTTTDVFVQCKIRACAQQPCGFCTGSGTPYRALQDVDLSPVEGEMYAPPVGLKVAYNDVNALVFPDSTPDFVPTSLTGPAAQIGRPTEESRPPTNKPIMVTSNLILSSVSASWAIQNREAVTQTLRTTMRVDPSEDLVITSISRLGRRELKEQARALQASGV